jgi:cytochrome c-type biogenesis protein CcmH
MSLWSSVGARFRLIVILLCLAGAIATHSTASFAVEPDEYLADPVLEARARALSAELRCLVCQNQSIDDSNAPLARDLRLLVRERLAAGSSDADVLRYLVDRYGEFVLLRPRFSPLTAILWLTPLLVLGGVIAKLWQAIRVRDLSNPAIVPPVPLSTDEVARLEQVLAQAKPSARSDHDKPNG